MINNLFKKIENYFNNHKWLRIAFYIFESILLVLIIFALIGALC